MPDDQDVPPALGWVAIDDALKGLYGHQEPVHMGTLIKWMLGGPDPLDGISAYRNEATVPHWHFVSYGMTELYEKESSDAEESGWGFEFTFRLKRDGEETEPPVWAFNFLQNLARYVVQTGNVFDVGHHMDANGPIALGVETDIRAILFSADTQLPAIQTPHGKVRFLQVVGITLDELDAARAWNSEGMLETLQSASNSLLVTDMKRRSVLQAVGVAAVVRERIRQEGSSTGSLFVSEVIWHVGLLRRSVRLRVGASAVIQLKQMFAGRTSHHRPFTLIGASRRVNVEPAQAFEWRENGDLLQLSLPLEAAADFAQMLEPKQGDYASRHAKALVIEVIPSQIRDRDGKLVQTIGE